MAKTRKVALDCTGRVVDRKCKKSTIKLNIDPTPEGWIGKSHARETPVGIVVKPTDNPEIKPISLFGIVKGCTIEFESIQVAPDRLADLEQSQTALPVLRNVVHDARVRGLRCDAGFTVQDALEVFREKVVLLRPLLADHQFRSLAELGALRASPRGDEPAKESAFGHARAWTIRERKATARPAAVFLCPFAQLPALSRRPSVWYPPGAGWRNAFGYGAERLAAHGFA